MNCRFFRDNPVVSRVRWVEAAPDAPTLPFPSVILSTQWEPDPWLESDVGEVAGASRATDLGRVPAGLDGGHVCGTAADFDQGGEYLPALPPVEYDANGYPRCCEGPKKVRGGVGAGGRADVQFVVPAPAPALNCCLAPTLEVGVTYGATTAGILVPQCFVYTTTPGTQYHLETDFAGIFFPNGVADGIDCLNLSTPPTLTGDQACQQWTSRDVFTCVIFNPTGGLGPYTFRLAEGPC